MNNKPEILLVGAGPMAIEYAKVLMAMKKEFIAVGRSKDSADKFQTASGHECISGGIEKWLKNNKSIPPKAMVVVTEHVLGDVTRKLIGAGIRDILVEKPGGLDASDIKKVSILAKKNKSDVFVGYNRRFCNSAIKAGELIKEAGGVKSFTFDFTERSYVVDKLVKAPGVKENWFLQNSSHVIDLAFYLAGWPKSISASRSGKLKWHPYAVYAGSGISSKGALFSYHANWSSAGRWGVEIMTSKNKLILRPIEKLFIQEFGSMDAREVALDDKWDRDFKPGLYLEVKSFLSDKKNLFTIHEQSEHLSIYKNIGGKI